MIVKVSGKVDGRNVIFDRAEGDQWKVTVPFDLDGMYVIEVTAEDDSGNVVNRRPGNIMRKTYSGRVYGGSHSGRP